MEVIVAKQKHFKAQNRENLRNLIVWKYHLVDVPVSEKLQKDEGNYFTPEIQY